MHRTSSPDSVQRGWIQGFHTEKTRSIKNKSVKAVQTLRQFKQNIVFAHVRRLYVHFTPVNKNMYYFVAMSFCRKEFYSSTVIERHFVSNTVFQFCRRRVVCTGPAPSWSACSKANKAFLKLSKNQSSTSYIIRK